MSGINWFENKDKIKLLLNGYLPNKWPNDLFDYLILCLYIEYYFDKTKSTQYLNISNDLKTVENIEAT